MEFERSIMFVKVVNGSPDLESDLLTEYQMQHLVGESDKDYYSQPECDYYRVYLQKNAGEYDKIYNYEEYVVVDSSHVECMYTVEQMPDDVVFDSIERNWVRVRAIRDDLLMQSDYESKIMIPDLWQLQSDEYKTAWLDYRQALRNIPQLQDNSYEVVFPNKPQL